MLILIVFLEDMDYFEQVNMFFQTAIPNPSVCGPLFLIWVLVCIIYLLKKVKSPILSTIVAAILVYFGTVNVIVHPTFTLDFPTAVHVFQAYVGYGYFIESIISKYKMW